MKIKAIGTGAIWSKKNSACYLIDEKILIDIPNGTCKELKRIGVEPIDIKYILLTHLHGDHYFDIPFLLLSKIKSEYICSVVIATSKDGISKIKKLTKLAFPNTIKKIKNKVKIKYETSQNFNIEDYKIEKVKVKHGHMKPAFGYILEKDNTKIGFSGDSCYCESIDYLAKNCKVLICDCSLTTGNSSHMGIDNLMTLTDKYPNCTIYATHLDDNVRDELKKQTKIKILDDGNFINIKEQIA